MGVTTQERLAAADPERQKHSICLQKALADLSTSAVYGVMRGVLPPSARREAWTQDWSPLVSPLASMGTIPERWRRKGEEMDHGDTNWEDEDWGEILILNEDDDEGAWPSRPAAAVLVLAAKAKAHYWVANRGCD